jgi:hypothetical protein
MVGRIGSHIRLPDGNFDDGRSMYSPLNEERRKVNGAGIISHRQVRLAK